MNRYEVSEAVSEMKETDDHSKICNARDDKTTRASGRISQEEKVGWEQF